jgi:catechol 2,3-dioxygenase-like lactoylglutathione lyase family enzyme
LSIKGIHHVGISVRNLVRSIAFYQEVLGMQLLEDVSFSGERYERILGLPKARGRIAVLRVGTLYLELFEFTRPLPVAGGAGRPVCDYGISHFSVEVDRIGELYARMQAADVPFHCEPLLFQGVGTATYARDPDGNVFELIDISQAAGCPTVAAQDAK